MSQHLLESNWIGKSRDALLNFFYGCSFPVMTNDFDGQIDYLEQFGSSNVRTAFILL